MSVIIANNKAYIKFQHIDVCSVIVFMRLLFPDIEVSCFVDKGNYKSTLLIDTFTIKIYKKKIVVEINNIDDENPVIRKAMYAYLNKMLKKYKTVKPFIINKKVDYLYDVDNKSIKSPTPIRRYRKYFDAYYIH